VSHYRGRIDTLFPEGVLSYGYIKSLKQLVHFYNTRDKYAFAVTSGHCPPGTIEKVTCWPMPEVTNNIDMTTGNLGLTDKEEDQIVAFLQTLSDGFTRPYPNMDTFTGQVHDLRSGKGPQLFTSSKVTAALSQLRPFHLAAPLSAACPPLPSSPVP